MKKTVVDSSRLIKLLFLPVFLAGSGLIILDQKIPVFSLRTAKAQTADKFDRQFDEIVRSDFFAGLTGDEIRLERAMKYCEDVLAKEPRHAQALVWHGGGLLARAARVYRKGDTKLGDQLWQQGLKEMDQALAYAPERIDVIIGRSATIIGLAQSGWDPRDQESRKLLESAVLGYEKVYQMQKPYFSEISEHSRGELLFGLSSGWSILGAHHKARFYLRLLTRETKGSSYEKEARQWIGRKPQVIQHDCRGCHLSESY